MAPPELREVKTAPVDPSNPTNFWAAKPLLSHPESDPKTCSGFKSKLPAAPPVSRPLRQATHMASIQLQANGKLAKVGLGPGWILIGVLNHPANSLTREPIQRRICRGGKELQLLQAGCFICPIVLARPSVPNLRCRFLQQMVLPVSMRGDKGTTGGLDCNGNTSPHLPQSTFNITPRARRTKAQNVVMHKGFE